MRKIIISILILFLNFSVFAENIIEGKIIDAQTKEALPGVNVYIVELQKGTVTNTNGKYVLKNLPKGKFNVQFSYMGYKTVIKNVVFNNTPIKINVNLNSQSIQSQEIVVSGGAYTSQHDNSINIESMSSKKMNSLGTQNLTQSLANLPGVDMIAKGPGVSKPVIRGLSMTNIILLNNGVKMENFQFSEDHPFLIDEFGIDKIEVIKGPASLLYGSDAVGGVINVIKEKPAPVGKTIGDYHVQYHSNTKGYVSNLGIRSSTGNFFWGIRSGLKSHSDYRDGNGNFVPNTRFNENSMKANIGVNKKYGSFKLYYDYTRPKIGMCVPPSINLVTEQGRKNKFWYQDLTNQIISSRNKIFIKDIKVDVNASYQMNNRKLQTSDFTPAYELVDMNLNTLSYETKFHIPTNNNSEYILGFQGMNEKNTNGDAPQHIIPNANVNDLSFFGLAQYNFFEKFKTQGGLRYDLRYVSTKKETNKNAVNKKFDNLSLSIGNTYEIDDAFLIRANFASAYRSPNIAELTQNGMHGVRYEQGNDNLKVQRNYESDLSVHYHSNSLLCDISGFYNKIDNYIYISPTSDSINGNMIYRYSQSNAVIYGGEFSLNYFPLKRLSLGTSYSYLIGKRGDGSNLPFIPQNKFKLRFRIQKEKIAFISNAFVSSGILIAAKQDRPAMFETETNGYNLVNVSCGGSVNVLNQKLILSINVNNLFNTTYFDHLSTLKSLNYYNMGRNIAFRVSVPFGI